MKSVFIFIIACAAQGVSAQTPDPTPAYHSDQADDFWTPLGGGVYEVATSAEDYAAERWERSIEDDKFTTSGGTHTSTGKYYAYGDITTVTYSFDDDFLYLSVVVAGDFADDGGSLSTSGLKGHYYYYFGKGAERYALNVDDGSSLGSSWSSSSIKLFEDGNVDLLGTGIGITYDDTGGSEADDSDGYENQISGTIFARADTATHTVEMALGLGDLGWSEQDFYDSEFSMVGVAVSNPSSVTDLFANDEFAFASGNGVEYDTVALALTPPIPVPEPDALMFLLAGGCLLGLRRRPLLERV